MSNSLKSIDGVSDVEVDLQDKLAFVSIDSLKVTVQALIAATTNIGFPSRIASPEQRPPAD